MAKLLALLVIALVCFIVNIHCQQLFDTKRNFGDRLDEVVVSSDLTVKRKSKENRQGKKVLMNVPSGTTGPPEKSTQITSRLVSGDGNFVSEKRERRDTSRDKFFDLGVAGYLLESHNR